MRQTTLALGFSFVLASCASHGPVHVDPPTAQRHPVTNEYHGVQVVDDYQWLEDANDPSVKAWSDAQNAAARSVLDSLPDAARVRTRVTQIMTAPSWRYAALQARPGRVYALKTQPPKQQPFVVSMPSAHHPDQERILVDPNTIDPTGGTSIDWFRASPDGSLVAVSFSKGGSESGDVHVFDAASGKEVFETIARVNGGTAGGDLAWTPDSKGFYYTRYPRAGERPPEDMDFYMQVYFHALGTSPDADRCELGKDFPRIAEIVLESDDHGRVLASMQKGDGGEFQHYLRTQGGQWQQVTTYDDRVVQAVLGPSSHEAGSLWLISLKNAPRGRLLRLEIDAMGRAASLSQAATVVPESDDALVHEFAEAGNIVVSRSRVYVTYQLGGPSEIRVFDHHGQRLPSPEQLPIAEASGLTPAPGGGLIFSDVSYTQPFNWYAFDPGLGATSRLPLASPSPVSFDDYEVVREMAASKDGTQVPVNIVRRKGIALDASHPCLVTAYGGYGVNITPAFRPQVAALLERGFVWAEANIRGGGEFGEPWHAAGCLTRKQNVFDDFAAACEHMVARGYTTREHLAIQGGSNGGLLMGATLTQHPDLARAVVSSVGIYDMLRVELSPNGAFNVTEFGTVQDPEQFKALHAYSPYHHVQDGAAYPAILFLTGANDPRVDPMQSRKMAARLQAAQGGKGLVLLRTSANSGHGIGTALAERIEQYVDQYAFLLWQVGTGGH